MNESAAQYRPGREKSMNKRMFVLFCTALILSLLLSTAFAGERPKDFRGLKWGTNISMVKGLVLVAADEGDTRKEYRRPSDSLTVGKIQVDEIKYAFVGNKLSSVHLRFEGPDFKGYEKYLSLKTLFFNLYGPPDKETHGLPDERPGLRIITHVWYASHDNEANVTLFWNELGSDGGVNVNWKGALKKDSGL